MSGPSWKEAAAAQARDQDLRRRMLRYQLKWGNQTTRLRMIELALAQIPEHEFEGEHMAAIRRIIKEGEPHIPE
jgi:hypothetical protein